MTEKLFWNDPYMKEFDATVRSVAGNAVVLDRTAFYATSGGQPNDTGTLAINGETYKVADVKNAAGEIQHLLDREAKASAGDKAHGTIDWERRYGHMRHHTAMHVIDGIIEKEYSGTVTGGQIYATRARIDFDLPQLNAELAIQIVAKAQKVIDEGHGIKARIISQQEALAIPNLARTEPGKELIRKLPEIRVLEIEGFDFQSDGGTHVANTKEVGTIKLEKVESKGTHRKRMEISLV